MSCSERRSRLCAATYLVGNTATRSSMWAWKAVTISNQTTPPHRFLCCPQQHDTYHLQTKRFSICVVTKVASRFLCNAPALDNFVHACKNLSPTILIPFGKETASHIQNAFFDCITRSSFCFSAGATTRHSSCRTQHLMESAAPGRRT